MKYRHSIGSLLNRIAALVRPAVRQVPADVSAIISSNRGSTIVEQFNDLYYSSRGSLQWRGINLIKNPCDLWTMIDLIRELRPGLIIETGTAEGGSATFYRDMADILGLATKIITIDINPKWSFDHAEVMRHCEATRSGNEQVLVCLDSDHSAGNVAQELKLYSPAVTIGSYCVVEDTNVNGHPSYPTHGPGPWEAVQTFVAGNTQFEVDLSRQSYLLTFNPGGYLRRVR
jgi:cephalosporin hydroxylase